MPEILYKLRNGLTVKPIENSRTMFIIITKNKEIIRSQGRIRGVTCGSIIHLVRDRDEHSRLACKGGGWGTGFDVVGYKRRPKDRLF